MRGSRADGKLKQFLFRVAKSPNKSLPLGNGNCKHLPFLVSWLAGPLVATLITITETTGDRTRPDQDRWESRNLVFSVQGGGARCANYFHRLEWSTLIAREQSRYCALIGWDHSVPTQALLCHKDTAQGTQIPLLRAFLAFYCVFMA